MNKIALKIKNSKCHLIWSEKKSLKCHILKTKRLCSTNKNTRKFSDFYRIVKVQVTYLIYQFDCFTIQNRNMQPTQLTMFWIQFENNYD